MTTTATTTHDDAVATLRAIADALNELIPTTAATVDTGASGSPFLTFTPPDRADLRFVVTVAGSRAYILRSEIPAALSSPAYASVAVARELLGDAAYRIVDGTYYSVRTPPEVIAILERSRRTRQRLRLHLGDTATGRDWLDEFDVTGHVGRSMGPIKIPILVSSARAHCGGGILDDCIVRIRSTVGGGADLYRHPLYHVPAFTLAYDPEALRVPAERRAAALPYPYVVVDDKGEGHARFKTEQERSRWFKKLGLAQPAAEHFS